MIKKLRNILLILIVGLLVLASCGGADQPGDTSTDGEGNEETYDSLSESEVKELLKNMSITIPSSSEMFKNRDKNPEYTLKGSIEVVFSETGVTFDQKYSKYLEADGTTLKIKYGNSFNISGSCSNGTIIVETSKDEKTNLVLNNLNLKNSSFSPIYVKSADKVFIIPIGDNTLEITGVISQIDSNTVNSVIFSKDDLTIQGEGKISITSNIYSGIVCKDDLKITGGTLDITSGAHALEANDTIRISGGSIEVNVTKDALHINENENTSLSYLYMEGGKICGYAKGDAIDAAGNIYILGGEIDIRCGNGYSSAKDDTSTKGLRTPSNIVICGGKISIDSSDDSIHSASNIVIYNSDITVKSGDDAIHADSQIVIAGGLVDIKNGYEGLEALNVEIKGGKVTINAIDDGINAAGGVDTSSSDFKPTFETSLISISGGYVYINAMGDGIDANKNIEISGGKVFIEGPVNNSNSPVDFGGDAKITGGTFIAIGSDAMAHNFTIATQGSLFIPLETTYEAGTVISLKNSQGQEIFSYTTTKPFISVVLSSPDLNINESYSISIGDTVKNFTLTSILYNFER